MPVSLVTGNRGNLRCARNITNLQTLLIDFHFSFNLGLFYGGLVGLPSLDSTSSN